MYRFLTGLLAAGLVLFFGVQSYRLGYKNAQVFENEKILAKFKGLESRLKETQDQLQKAESQLEVFLMEGATEKEYVLVGDRLEKFRKNADKLQDKHLKSALSPDYEAVIFGVSRYKIAVHVVPVGRYPPKADDIVAIGNKHEDFEALKTAIDNLSEPQE